MIEAQAVKDKVLISPQAMTNGQTVTAQLDTLNGDYATIRVFINAGATNTIASANGVTVSLATSDVTNSTTFTTLTGSSFSGVKTSQEDFYGVGTGTKPRYIQLSVVTGTSGVTNENVTVCAVGSLSRLTQDPSAASALVTGTNDQAVLL